MDSTHLHLLINHAPLFGIVFGLIVLLLGYWRKSDELKLVATILFLISSIMIVPVHQTGDSAEHTVEEIAGVNHDDIEEHEAAAQFALYWTLALGVVSIVTLLQYRSRKVMPKGMTLAVLILSLFCFTVIARTAYLGGFIRHTEIHSSASTGDDNH